MQSRPNMVLDSQVTEDPDLGNKAENEVVDDPLSAVQEQWYNKFEKDYEGFMSELDKLIEVGDVVAKNDAVLALQVPGETSVQLPSSVVQSTTQINPVSTNRPTQQSQPTNPPPASNLHLPSAQPGGVFLQSAPANVVARPTGAGGTPGTYQLVMDPRLGGFFVGPVPSISTSGVSTNFRQTTAKNPTQIRGQTATTTSTTAAVAAPAATATVTPVPVTKTVIVSRNEAKAVPPTTTTTPGATIPKPTTKVSPWVANTTSTVAPTTTTSRILPSTSSVPVKSSASASPNISTGRGRGRPPKFLTTPPARTIAPTAGSAPVVDLTDEERLTRPLVKGNIRTYNNNSSSLSSSGSTTTAPSIPSAATTNFTGSVNNSIAKTQQLQTILNKPPPLSTIAPKPPLIAPKPSSAQIRGANNVGSSVSGSQIRLNVLPNQVRSPAPVNTMRSPANTTRPPANTTRPPANTTRPPANTTRPPANTTRPPANTTRSPANTTRSPANTTRSPANTTRPSVNATRPSVNATRPSANTTRSPAINNGPSASVNNGARPHASGLVPADSREMNFNKLGVGRTFPSLVVLAKPTMRIQEFSLSALSRDRTELDQQVKELLLNSMTKLTEWLIQQGLVRSSQVCQTHRAANGTPVSLKLGIYSDASKFPHSGGYVWICEYCPPQLFVSVFSGSIFEGAPHPPLVLLKLIYHWSCQTTSSNIVSWVKVESYYVKTFFARMRAVCTAAVHENYEVLGGPSKRVEVGVISLGTAAHDGTTRNVKVEVLGVMDPENKLIRLRAVEPLRDGEKNYKRRFVKILEPLAKWVHKKSIILTDYTVDKGTLHNMGFSSVFQVAVNPDTNPDSAPKYSNINVMNYLRRVVPRMFQNTLSLLSRQIIQQFLDELVWRERWGPLPSQAFNTIIRHIAEQTRANSGSSFLKRLSKISDDPFKEWRYAVADEEVQLLQTETPNTSTAHVPVAPTLATGTVALPPANSNIALTPVTPDLLRPSIDMLPQSIREPNLSTLEQGLLVGQAVATKRNRKRPADGNALGGERPRKRLAEPNALIDPRKVIKEVKKSTPFSTLVVGTEQTTSLQAYYYGTLEGDPTLMGVDKVEIPVLKCSACPSQFTNNILLMKHLILHTQFSQFSCDLDDVTQCKYCLKTFPTPFSMQTHLEEVHLTAGSPDICMICSEKFKDTTALIQHMHRTHVALEMPYVCHVCQFRSSLHRDLIDHFYEVHNNGEKMQCPFCLKTVAVAANGRRLGSNISFFLAHIQKHQRRSVAKKCSRCALWFVHKWAIRVHLQRDHVSFKDVAGVKPAQPEASDDIKMPLPPAELGPSASLVAFRRGPNFPSRGSHSTTYLLPALELQSNINEFTCIECKEEITESHYPGYTMCSRCRFATCCPKTMKDHMRTFHELYAEHPVFDMSPPITLTTPMYCVCGFSSSSGNCIAKHLAICERKSAYPSPARAKAATVQSASFPPLVTLDDVDNSGDDPSDKWLKAFVPTRQNDSEGSRDAPEKKTSDGDTHSMLNVLGLVRKPSTDESSLDKAPSDKEDAAEPPATACT